RTNGKDKIKPDTMLGEVQKQWLFDQLKASTATFKVIGTSVPISSGTKPGNAGNDTWDGFSEDREELFSFIEKNKIEGVFFVAADRHRSDAWKTNRKNGYPFYEFMSSRLTNNHTHPVMPNSLFGYNKTPSFGLLEFDTTSKDPKVIYRIFNIENEEIHQMTVYKTELSFPGK
ncbi:MAG: alkaline phosphatase D family protein, partial [Bacteroidetes bacterium]|nr:alkaline phosphatase D family protein [Bacteroidota bacterium]